jgi:choline-sulfatase
MSSNLNRRDFLKIVSVAGLASMVHMLPGERALLAQNQPLPNVIVLVLDALSAINLSLYGYERKTSPNLEKLASRATIYNAHYSAANFTTPSTASLLTGVHPWTHRAFRLGGLISPPVQDKNIFHLLSDVYYTNAFTQNIFADLLLYQFDEYIDQHTSPDQFALSGKTFYDKLFKKDAVYAIKGVDQFLFKPGEAHGSLFLSLANDLSNQIGNRIADEKEAQSYPDGLPDLTHVEVYFSLQQVMDGYMQLLGKLPAPFFSYVHLLPPHGPYKPDRQFIGMFDDGWKPQAKKKHPLGPGVPQARLNEQRATYDEYIANVDFEIGRLLAHLEMTGLLQNSYLMITSDHGELFERGVRGHASPLVFEPGVRIPLIVAAPGQKERRDVHVRTSNIDLLPTVLHLSGQPLPNWLQGQILPGLGGQEDPERSLFILEAKENPAYQPLSKATFALIKGEYKLIYYLGYEDYPRQYEFFDLKSDPEELKNLYPAHPAAAEMQAELDQKLQEVNRPYIQAE